MSRTMRIVLGGTLALLVAGGALAYFLHKRDRVRNFHVVEAGVLYRSAQLSPANLRQVHEQYGIKTVISLREGQKSDDSAEESECQKLGIRFLRLPPRLWVRDENGEIPVELNLNTFREVMNDSSHFPVLIHCWGGIHRTGAYCAIFRMDYQGWPKEQAIAEMKALGYTIYETHQDVVEFMDNYRPHPRADRKAVDLKLMSRSRAKSHE